MARRQAARLVPGATRTGSRRWRTLIGSSRSVGTRSVTVFDTAASLTHSSVGRPRQTGHSAHAVTRRADAEASGQRERRATSGRGERPCSPARLGRMDRRRAFGLLLVLVSACGFGSGGLFAQPVYEAGVGWQVLSAWRFGFAAVLAWLWVLAWPDRRRGLRLLDRRIAIVAIALGVLYTANSGTYYAGLEVVSVSLASIIVYIYPAIVAVMSLRLGRRLEGRRSWFALGLAMAGPDPGRRLARAGRGGRCGDVHRYRGLLRRRPPHRQQPGGPGQHDRAHLDDHTRGDHLRPDAGADPTRGRG